MILSLIDNSSLFDMSCRTLFNLKSVLKCFVVSLLELIFDLNILTLIDKAMPSKSVANISSIIVKDFDPIFLRIIFLKISFQMELMMIQK